MKWIALIFVVALIPPLSGWLRAHPREAPKIWIFVGLAPFIIGAFHLEMSIIDWATWPGYSKGLQVSVLDILALAILFSLPRARQTLPFKFVMALYFVAVLLSISQAQVPMAAVFFAWQLARVYLVYVIVARATVDESVPTAILTGMTIGLCYQAAASMWERFGHGVLQATGTFGHQNFLALVSEFAIFPLVALLLAGKRGWQVIVGPAAGLIIVALTTSRAAVGLCVIGLGLLFILSSLRSWTPRKASVLAAGIVATIILSPLVLSSFEKRFADSTLSLESDERELFEDAARLVLADHPLGVGVNNYVIVANTGGYLTRAGVPWGGGQREALVHNAYWLAAAETGYFGVAAFVLLIFSVVATALKCGWQKRQDLRGDLQLGLGVSLLVVAVHCKYEWVFFMPYTLYLFAISTGMVAGLAIQLRYSKRSQAGYSEVLKPSVIERERVVSKGLLR